MGKSSELTRLRDELENQITSNRIIIRIDLRTVQILLDDVQVNHPEPKKLSLKIFLRQFIPLDTVLLKNDGNVGVYTLLDGLDEILPNKEIAIIRMLNYLLEESKKERKKVSLERLVLTTRPHFKEVV